MSHLATLRGGLIVSCQAARDTPLARPDILALIAISVVRAGAVGIRAEGVSNLTAIRAAVQVPLIGLWKEGTEGPYITPTLEHARAVARTGADIIAIDATDRPRQDGRRLVDVVTALHQEAGALVLADISTLDEGIAAVDAGADLIATTLAGYTPYSRATDGPDLDLVRQLCGRVTTPVVAEGRIRTPTQARDAITTGAWAVVVGHAITNPGAIATDFLRELEGVPATP
jgi:N-acylglucosamine-6-phosphate 2-epimerase